MTLFCGRKAGRPRKQGVPRNVKGAIAYGHRSATEDSDAVRRTAEEARIRQLWGVDVWLKERRSEKTLAEARKRAGDPLLGYALGRFLYAREIDQKQHDAGMYFAWLWKANAKIRGWPSPNVKALDYDASFPGLSTYPESSDAYVAEIRRKWGDTYRYILQAQQDFGPVFEILKRTLLEDVGPRNASELGNLRIGLNAINQARGV
ncbi:hypothetical protein [Microvirga sp. TS319]|uniref:hypothetical protein n=1 Tax=Microvirga sp. TS319 TaxID=3241165 RepID=UPI003519E480